MWARTASTSMWKRTSNGSAPGTGTAGRQLYPFVTSDLNEIEPFGDMTYHALQATVRSGTGRRSLAIASYTFSKAINNYNGDNNDATLWRAYPVSYALDKQIAGFDRPNNGRFQGEGATVRQGAYMAESRLGVLGGGQLAAALERFRESGLPFGVGTTSNINAGGQSNSDESDRSGTDFGRPRCEHSLLQRIVIRESAEQCAGLNGTLPRRRVWAGLLSSAGTPASRASSPSRKESSTSSCRGRHTT